MQSQPSRLRNGILSRIPMDKSQSTPQGILLLSLLGATSHNWRLCRWDDLILVSTTDNRAILCGPNNNNRVAKFSSIRSLTLFFSENFGGDTTKISFIGLKGEFSEASTPASIDLTNILRRKEMDHIVFQGKETNQSCNYLTYLHKKKHS